MKLDNYPFRAHVIHQKLYVIKITVSNTLYDDMDFFASPEFRSINKKDPHFCYTCRCNSLLTIWELAYSKETTIAKASNFIEKGMKTVNNPTAQYSKNKCKLPSFLQPKIGETCTCPFEKN